MVVVLSTQPRRQRGLQGSSGLCSFRAQFWGWGLRSPESASGHFLSLETCMGFLPDVFLPQLQIELGVFRVCLGAACLAEACPVPRKTASPKIGCFDEERQRHSVCWGTGVSRALGLGSAPPRKCTLVTSGFPPPLPNSEGTLLSSCSHGSRKW